MPQENETKTASLGNGGSADGLTGSTDRSMDFLDPNSSAPDMPRNLPIPLPEVAIPISAAEMAQISKELGLTRWSPDRLRAMGAMGDMLREQGAVRVAAGEFVYSNMLRAEIISECRERLKSVKDPEVYSLILSQLNTMLGGKDSASKMMIEVMKLGLVKEPESEERPKMPPRGVNVVIVQNNASVEPKPVTG